MSVTHAEALRAVQEMTKRMNFRLESLTNGLTTIRGWQIEGTNQQLGSSGNSYLFIATDGIIYRVTHTSSQKAGPRKFLESQYETERSIQTASVFDIGKDNDEILDRLEATYSYQMSF